jgi:hypothetical protein
MDVDQLLEIQRQGGNRSHERLQWQRRLACYRGRAQQGWKIAHDRTIRKKAQSAHEQYHDRERAHRMDDYFRDPGKSAGSGRWRQHTPDQILRECFASPARSLVSLAALTSTPAAKTSTTYVKDLMMMCGQMLVQKMATAVKGVIIDRRDGQFNVIQVMADESKFSILPGEASGRGRATDQSIVAMHGRLLWNPAPGAPADTQEDDLILKPVAVHDTTTASIWSAFRSSCPPEVWELISGHVAPQGMVAICLGFDHHPACLKFIAAIEGNAPDNAIVLPGLCKQHGSGLCLAPLIKHLKISCPTYCVAKQFRSDKFFKDLKAGVKISLRTHMTIKDRNWRPEDADIKYSQALLEMTYYRRDLRTSTDADRVRPEIQKELESLRRKKGGALIDACSGDWRMPEVVFWNRAGEDLDLDAAVDRVYDLLMIVSFHVIGDPGTNKWLTLWRAEILYIGFNILRRTH